MTTQMIEDPLPTASAASLAALDLFVLGRRAAELRDTRTSPRGATSCRPSGLSPASVTRAWGRSLLDAIQSSRARRPRPACA